MRFSSGIDRRKKFFRKRKGLEEEGGTCGTGPQRRASPKVACGKVGGPSPQRQLFWVLPKVGEATPKRGLARKGVGSVLAL
jgi:hypothetical protein